MTTSTNVTCPECGAVLRPAKPLRPGKSVKCPKCGAGFVAGEEAPAPAARKAASPVQIKPTAGVPVAPVMHHDDDDEGGGGTYGVRGEVENTGPDIDYMAEVGIRDLRGPAMQEVVDPSNKLILVSATGFLGWVAFLVTLVIPILFPLESKEDRDKARQIKLREIEMQRSTTPHGVSFTPPKVEEDTSFMMIGNLDLRSIGELKWYLAVACLLPTILGMIYSAILAMGAVKIQNLESRDWGIASSVMAMVPLNAGGLLCMLALVLNIVLDWLFDGWFKWVVLGFLLVCAWGTNLAAGIWMLTILNKPHVIAGYEYVAE